MERFGEKLRTLRTKQGLSQRQLGEVLGVSGSHIGKIEQGYKVPHAAMILALSRFFDISIDYLMKDELELDN